VRLLSTGLTLLPWTLENQIMERGLWNPGNMSVSFATSPGFQRTMKEVTRGKTMKTFAKFRNSARVLICVVSGCFSLAPYVAFAQKSPPVPPDLISSEVGDLNSFLELLEKLSTQSETLEGKTKVTPEEKKSVEDLSKQVKNKIPSAKRNLESIITKTKAHGKWTPALDSEVIEQISGMQIPEKEKSRFIELIKQNGGAKAVLEKGVQALSGADKNIDDTLRTIDQKQSGSWLFGTAYANPLWSFWRCLGVLAVGVAAGLAGQVGVTYGAAVVAASNC
jgi:hypothetical protein